MIIMAYCQLDDKEVKEHKPKVVFVNEQNKIVKTASYEKYGVLSQDCI
ncbi:MAG: aspartate 1-decarboxylase [Acutalibacteraceae bacterium]|nr:aspartate 1-decarboxylase [Acutalibacteraceae bacterium]